MAQHNDHIYINAFNHISGIGPQKLHRIANVFETFKDAWNADIKTLQKSGLSHKIIQNINEQRKIIDLHTLWDQLTIHNITLITIHDKNFPKKLTTIIQPPFCLYVRGNIGALQLPSVTIVGSRKISDYGTHATNVFAGDIAHADITIISGLALGTDGLAHRAALNNNKTTIAVLGSGIDDTTITPRTHINLAREILQKNGTIISEYPPGAQPNRGTFPARNRLMVGLADATVIIEATEKSGTLITATYAHKNKRPLFALPGSIFSTNSLGPNQLIQSGKAHALLCSDDILRLFHVNRSPKHKITPHFTDEHQKLLHHILTKNSDGMQINHLIKKSGFDTTTVSSALTIMEIQGIVKNIGNQTYIAQQ